MRKLSNIEGVCFHDNKDASPASWNQPMTAHQEKWRAHCFYVPEDSLSLIRGLYLCNAFLKMLTVCHATNCTNLHWLEHKLLLSLTWTLTETKTVIFSLFKSKVVLRELLSFTTSCSISSKETHKSSPAVFIVRKALQKYTLECANQLRVSTEPRDNRQSHPIWGR